MDVDYQGTSFKPATYATVFAIILTEGVRISKNIIIYTSGARYNPGKIKEGIEAKTIANDAKSI